MVDMPGTAEIRLTVHIYKFRYLRVRNYNGCKIYFNSFLAQSQGFFGRLCGNDGGFRLPQSLRWDGGGNGFLPPQE
jgi:hypothetical protein